MSEWPQQLDALLEEDADDLYEQAPCGYLSLLPDGVIGKVNGTFLQWMGFDRDALLGQRRFVDLLTVGGRIFYETHFQPLLRMQGAVREIAFDLVQSSGERLPVLVNATQRAAAGTGSITRITVFDATDRRRYERDLVAARDRAEQAAQTKSELVSMISHDIRAPISAILTAAALLEKTQSSPQQAKYVRVLQSSAAHVLELVNNVLDLTRIESGRARLQEREFAFRELMGDIAAGARAAAMQKPTVAINVAIDEAVPERLVGDRATIAQVLANLMMNGVKFTDRGFVSLVVTRREAGPDRVTLEFVVSDSGIGIPADRLPHIFDEFTQASDEIADQYGGSGLGLAISRRLLQLYGAELHVTSTVGQGTTFSFVLSLGRAVA